MATEGSSIGGGNRREGRNEKREYEKVLKETIDKTIFIAHFSSDVLVTEVFHC